MELHQAENALTLYYEHPDGGETYIYVSRRASHAKSETGHFNPELMLKAIARGAAMNIDLTDSWDPWTVMDRDIDELRTEYGIAPGG